MSTRPSSSSMRAFAARGQGRIVGDQHQGGVVVAIQRKQQVADVMAGALVEVAGGFVGKQHARAMHECAGDRHALLLAAGQLGRVVSAARGQADRFQRVARALAGGTAAFQFQRQHHVFLGGQRGQQVERLEHETDQPPAQIGAGLFVQLLQRMAIQRDAAGIRRVQPGQQAEQGGLARAGGADDGETLARADLQADVRAGCPVSPRGR